jgi:hypothetical protein
MTRTLTRTNFPGSTLIRTLADLAVLQTDEPGGAFAEKLGQWINFTGAIALSAVHNEGAAAAPGASRGGKSVAGPSIGQDYERTRLAMAQSIRMSFSATAGKTLIELPTPHAGASHKEAAAYGPYRRFHLALQRDMELGVSSLRARVREQIAKARPGLRPLLDLDEAMEGILGEREGKLLATVALLLQRRFAHLLKDCEQTPLEAGREEKPEQWMKPGAWLARFCTELQTVLLAELELRLQPTLGLIEAYNNEKIKRP